MAVSYFSPCPLRTFISLAFLPTTTIAQPVSCVMVRSVAAAQEERFTRKKHDSGFPRNAIDYCLREGGITSKQLDYVAFYEKPFVKFDRILHSYLAYAPRGIHSFLKAIPVWIKDKLWMKAELQNELDFERSDYLLRASRGTRRLGFLSLALSRSDFSYGRWGRRMDHDLLRRRKG